MGCDGPSGGAGIVGVGVAATEQVEPDRLDLLLERGPVAAVVDDVGGEPAALLVAGLGCHAPFGVGAGHAPLLEAGQADLAGGLDDDDELIAADCAWVDSARSGTSQITIASGGAARIWAPNSSLMAG